MAKDKPSRLDKVDKGIKKYTKVLFALGFVVTLAGAIPGPHSPFCLAAGGYMMVAGGGAGIGYWAGKRVYGAAKAVYGVTLGPIVKGIKWAVNKIRGKDKDGPDKGKESVEKEQGVERASVKKDPSLSEPSRASPRRAPSMVAALDAASRLSSVVGRTTRAAAHQVAAGPKPDRAPDPSSPAAVVRPVVRPAESPARSAGGDVEMVTRAMKGAAGGVIGPASLEGPAGGGRAASSARSPTLSGQ